MHSYAIGRSGTGKSTWLANKIAGDLSYDNNFAILDPHGALADAAAAASDPKKTIYFHRSCPLGFNPFDKHSAEDILSSFKHIWRESWGPRMEYILRLSLRLLEQTKAPTLLQLPIVLTDTRFRKQCLKDCTDPFVRYFWEQEFASYSDRFMQEAISPIQNKVGEFCADPTIRAVLVQRSVLDFDDVLNGKNLIVNFEGMGEEPSHLLGALFVTAIHQAASRRATIPESRRMPFTLYADEFQRFATASFATILSESRKWGLRLCLANQYLDQLPPELRHAVLGNISSLTVFRVSAGDAEILAAEMGIAPENAGGALVDTPNFQARVVRVSAAGTPSSPYLVKTTPPQWVTSGMLGPVKRWTRANYARPKEKIDAQIARIFGKNERREAYGVGH